MKMVAGMLNMMTTPIEYHKPTHFAPYIAVAALHYYKIFKDKEKIKELWPTIQSY